MAPPKSARLLTEREYLDIERVAQFRSEFFDGEMFAMAGGSANHSLIAANVSGELSLALKLTRYFVFGSNLRVNVEGTGLYTYPDITVACEERRFSAEDPDCLINPTLLVEVLSDSTEAYDRGQKFGQYRQIPSLREYLLVSQHEPRLEQYVRQSGDTWLLREVVGTSSTLELPSIGVTLSLAEVYAKVEFAKATLR